MNSNHTWKVIPLDAAGRWMGDVSTEPLTWEDAQEAVSGCYRDYPGTGAFYAAVRG